MSRRMNITAARKRFLSLPEELAGGDSLEVFRRGKAVLRIVRVPEAKEVDPSLLLEEALARLPEPEGQPPADLATHYKDYLYGKKG